MTVREFINQLSELNPDSKLQFGCEIERGRSVSSCEDGKVGIHPTEEGVLIKIWGEETDWE